MILFRKVNEPATGWLSNMSPHPIGIWRTAEAMFQAARFIDDEIKEKIKACKSPMGAKMMAKSHADKMQWAPRSETDLASMQVILMAKVMYHPALYKALLATGDEIIVEDVTNRQNESGLFWGAVVENGAIVRGQNHLGRLWMELREQLKKDVASGRRPE